jgi:hypothetical protein
MKRRDAIKAVAVMPVAAAFGKNKKPEPERVVLSASATKRFREIFKDGGVITGITVSYNLPSESGRIHHGTSFLFGGEVKGIEIK